LSDTLHGIYLVKPELLAEIVEEKGLHIIS